MVKLRNILVLSRQCDIKEGVRQGDPLACLLFNISLEKVIRDAEVDIMGIVFDKSVQILIYVDDIVIIGHFLAVVKEAFINIVAYLRRLLLSNGSVNTSQQRNCFL
jgi:hypothetical protein